MDVRFVLVLIGCFHTIHANFLKEKEDWLKGIYPGTKWCGLGNKAENDDDLGSIDKLDACCRDHDKCPIRIGALQSGFGLKNKGLTTRRACSCEDIFFDCLKAISSGSQEKHANAIGTIYFKLIHPKCAKETNPKICIKKFLGICFKSAVDKSKTEYKWTKGKRW